MLKKFLLNSLSAFVGAWVALMLFIFATVLFFIGLAASVASVESVSVSKHSILKLSLSGTIEEKERATEFDYNYLIQGGIEKPQTLNVIVKALQEAAINRNIDALYIECGGVSAAPATLNAIRSQVAEFKKSGKKVYAYGDGMTMGDYFVASVADSLFVNPYGEVHLAGISGTTLFFKDLLDKVGIEFEVVKVGTYKSAVEPYIMNEMSAPARAQLDTLYTEMWDYILKDMASGRRMKASGINRLVNEFVMLKSGKDLVKYGLVDRSVYKREIDDIMARLVGRDRDKLHYVNPDALVGSTSWGAAYGSKRQIAVLYATGDIAETPSAGINCEKLVPVITSLAEDDKVKGLVLRVNSPGGSVFGSEQIGEALDYFQSKGKKLAVSMGDYAASGGYWISAGADRIFADPLTITGSIGIFGLVPNISGLTGKLGVHPQTVSTNPGVAFPSLFYPMNDAQRAALQANIEQGYDRFISRVAKGRHKSKEYIRSIAEGRVWSAPAAKRIGLVDELGSLSDAIKWVASESGVDDHYDVAVYPSYKPSVWDMVPAALQENAAVQELAARFESHSVDKALARWAAWMVSRPHAQAISLDVDIRL